MITWHEELPYDFSDNSTDRIFTEQALFFDIETTGFSPARTSLYLIGCAARKADTLYIDQFFAETPSEEAAVLNAFFALLSQYKTILTYNGIGFDIPYLKAKCTAHHIAQPFDGYTYVDIYKEVSSLKFLLALPDYKQKSIERFLGIDREDAYNGGELIEVYKEYVHAPAKETLALLRQHNYEDVCCMPRLLPVFSYRGIWSGDFTVSALDANEYTSMDGCCGNKELIFTLSLAAPVPVAVSAGCDDCYLSVTDTTARLRVRLFDGTLKFFYENVQDYYYLPDEDYAVHKSVASYVDKEHRQKAMRSNCYRKEHAIFLPQYETVQSPAFREQLRDKKTYFKLSEEFIHSKNLQHRYVQHILQTIRIRRKS